MTKHGLPISIITTLFVLFCALAVLIFTTEAAFELPRNESIPGVIIFGDSIVDTGNNNDLMSLTKCNFPPYGRDFKGGIPTGRFSNGKVPSDLLAEELGIKELLPAFRDPTLQPKDLLTGVSFASGGAGYDPLTSNLASVIPLSQQLKDFEQYRGRLKGIVGEERTNYVLAKSFTFVVASSNDIGNTYFIYGVRKSQYDVPSYTDLLVTLASKFVKELYGMGSRRIGVLGAPPIGCVPSMRTLVGGLGKECVEEPNEAAKMFNAKLAAEMRRLSNTLPHARVVYIDVYTPLLDLIKNSNKYGFEIADRGCCGTGTVELSILCSQLDPHTCKDDSKYVFFDSYHPTEKAYKTLVDQVVRKYGNSLL